VIAYGSGSYAPRQITVAINIITGSSGKLVTVYQGSDIEFRLNLLYPTGSARMGNVPADRCVNANPPLVILDDITYSQSQARYEQSAGSAGILSGD
jgi:hypothetical protein